MEGCCDNDCTLMSALGGVDAWFGGTVGAIALRPGPWLPPWLPWLGTYVPGGVETGYPSAPEII